ncbi:hypothetical protein NDU88_000923 [Pleurodeles waltl]|uniref:Uncharacterized protein n=1 Tax=Pleurodeles waltl TaxID=8319 RepID=A0AAV7V818_PLEWA|nr:hypothetical protein NDU88_000923 [Pleurodeles waltl]
MAVPLRKRLHEKSASSRSHGASATPLKGRRVAPAATRVAALLTGPLCGPPGAIVNQRNCGRHRQAGRSPVAEPSVCSVD